MDAAPKRDGIVVPEASGAGLARWSGETGVIQGGGGRLAFNRAGRSGRMAACSGVIWEMSVLFKNGDQADSDGNGVGDLCDCESEPTAGLSLPVDTVEAPDDPQDKPEVAQGAPAENDTDAGADDAPAT